MDGCYEIMQGDKVLGTVKVEKQGLYYHFSCRCRLTGEVIHRLAVSCGDKKEDLGVCVPMDGQFGVEKKVPCKRLGVGKPVFHLLPKHKKMEGKFVPIYPEEPFAYIHRLEGAFLKHQAGQLGILLKE